MYRVLEILTEDEVAECRRIATATPFVDGRISNPHNTAKQNEQLHEPAAYQKSSNLLRKAMLRSPDRGPCGRRPDHYASDGRHHGPQRTADDYKLHRAGPRHGREAAHVRREGHAGRPERRVRQRLANRVERRINSGE